MVSLNLYLLGIVMNLKKVETVSCLVEKLNLKNYIIGLCQLVIDPVTDISSGRTSL